jgi:glucokinase
MSVIGIDLGGTKIAAAVFAENGEMSHQRVVPLAGASGKQVGEMIAQMTLQLLSHTEAKAVGISVPGIAHVKQGTVWAPNIPGWESFPLVRELTQKLEAHKLWITMDCDRACYIQGERWLGRAKGCPNAIFLAVGTGIGAGILVDGNVLRGSQDIAGAVGWLALSQSFKPAYEACGDFEHHASGPGLVRIAQDLLHDTPSYQGSLRGVSEWDARVIFAAYERGDTLAAAVLEQAIAYWGRGVANLISIFNPEKIIFGGGVFGPASKFLTRITEEARRWAQPISMQQVSLEVSALGGNAGLVGAGYLALQTMTSP